MDPKHLLHRLERLREDFTLTLPRRLTDLSRQVGKLAREPSAEDLERFVTGAESLRDAARIFAFDALAAAAGQIAQELPGHFPENATAVPDRAKRSAIRALLMTLDQAARRSVDTGDAGRAHERSAVMVFDDDRARRAELQVELTLAGYRSEGRDSIDEIEGGESLADAHAIVVEAEQIGDDLIGLAPLRASCGEHGAGVPVILVSDRGDTDARLRAMRAGVDGYFTRPVDFRDLHERLGELAQNESAPTHEIVVVDDNAKRARRATKALAKANIATHVAASVKELNRALKKALPDLILLDVGMKSVDVRALARRLRKTPGLEELPVVLFTADAGRGGQDDDADSEAADTVRSEQLLALVGSHIYGARQMKRDSSTARRHGELAKLSNQDYFLSTVENAVTVAAKGSQRFGLLHIGLDGIEDFLAGAAPEELEAFAHASEERLLVCLRSGDVPARLTGDSFVVLLKNVRADQAQRAGERIREDFSDQLFECGELSFPVTCTVGVSVIDSGTESTEEALAQAQSAYAIAATSTTSKVHLHDSVADALAREQHETRQVELLKRGLESEGLRLMFQPVLRLQTQETEAFEASLSLTGEDGKELPDSPLAALSERAGLAADVDRWFVSKAVDFIAGKAPERVRLMMTLSRDTLRDAGFPAWLEARLSAAKISPDSLVLGFETEVVSGHLKEARNTLKALAGHGILTRLTHFGRTPSPMLILKHVSVDFLCVDGSVIERIGNDPQAAIALGGMVESARARHTALIASAVETPATLTALWSCGVDLIQGGFVGPRSASVDQVCSDGIHLSEAESAA